MRAARIVAVGLLVALAGRAAGDPAVTVVDGAASFAEQAPTPGADLVLRGVADGLRFSNAGADQRQVVALSAAHALVRDHDGASVSVAAFQGATVDLADLHWAAQSATGPFHPLRVATSSDQTGQPGWTKSSACGAVTYQGRFSISWYSNAGVAQAPLARNYQVCDANAIWVDADQDFSSGADFAYAVTHATGAVLTGEADYEIVIDGVEYVFAGAADASSVTIRQGRYLSNPLLGGVSTWDVHSLLRFPDGFPAGVETTTVTAAAYDVTL